MRRTTVILASAWSVVAIAVAAPAASAHGCATPVQVAVGTPVAVPVGVTAEATEVSGIDIELPPSFRVATVQAPPGWVPRVEGSTAQLRGGRVAPFGCGYVTLRGTFTEKGVVALPLVLHHADGTTTRLTGRNPQLADAAQLVYAGVQPPDPNEESSREFPTTAVVGIGVAVVVAAGLVVNRRLRRAR